MWKIFSLHSEDMLLSIVIWLCTLPFIALIVAPAWGVKMAGLFSLGVLVTILAVCWSLCGWKVLKK
jgi:hypothetical protein